MLPLAYLLLTVFRVQGAAYAVSSATREAGRVYVTSAASPMPERADEAAWIVMADSGALSMTAVEISCSACPCLTPGARSRWL